MLYGELAQQHLDFRTRILENSFKSLIYSQDIHKPILHGQTQKTALSQIHRGDGYE